MKKSLLISAIALGIYYLLRDLLSKEETLGEPRRKHLTNAFSKAKEHAISAVTE